jgi:8-oxo-dGTP pyrophosphatase MutT (NUDIX family)
VAPVEAPAPAKPRDSATVLLLRERSRGFEIYMVRRHGRSAFMANAHVFPGGTVDDQDGEAALWERTRGRTGPEAARALGEGDPHRALSLHCTAVRETFEEAGVLLGEGPADPPRLAAARQALLDGGTFLSVLAQLGACLEIDRLVPHSRWITPTVEPRRYDARFFLAMAPPDQTAEHDRVETTAGLWISPGEALAQERQGRIQLAPPTMRTLEALADHGSAAAAVRAAAERVPPTIEPRFQQLDGQLVLCLPGDPEHPIEEPALPGPTRMVLEDGRWWSRSADQD